MRQVRTCDFCGDDATGLYEPLSPTVPDGPRMLLCDGCRDRLSSVVEPLVERIEGDAGAPGEATTGEPDARGGSGVSVAEPASTADPEPKTEDTSTSSRPSTATPGVSESRDASGRAQHERAGTPPGYRKVLRFLENRQFPIDRSEAVQLTADAYELDEDAVEAVIDHAVEYGRLREVSGELKR